MADPPHGASKASLPHEVAACPPAAPHTAAPSDPSLAPKQGDQSPKQSDIRTSTAAPITATHLAAGERKFTREMYLTAVKDMYPEHNMDYLRSHMVLDDDWRNVRLNAASNAFRAVKDIIEAKEPVSGSSNDDDKQYDSDGNTVASVASYMEKKPKKTYLAVIAASKLSVLLPWSSTRIQQMRNTDFGVSAVERVYMLLLLVNMSHSTMPCNPIHLYHSSASKAT